jgi:hypothetical protein
MLKKQKKRGKYTHLYKVVHLNCSYSYAVFVVMKIIQTDYLKHEESKDGSRVSLPSNSQVQNLCHLLKYDFTLAFFSLVSLRLCLQKCQLSLFVVMFVSFINTGVFFSFL